jgi:hypothetical protein
VFAGHNGSDGLQVWVSDGSLAGTQPLGRVGTRPGIGAVRLDRFTPFGTRVLFVCDDGITGDELWIVSLGGSGTAYTQTYGEACQGTGGKEPRIGALGAPVIGSGTFAVTLADALPAAPAVLNCGFAPSSLSFGACRLLVQVPVIPLATVQTTVVGGGTVTLAIPNDPRLVGVMLFGQWAVADPQGQLRGFAALSDGLLMRLGR